MTDIALNAFATWKTSMNDFRYDNLFDKKSPLHLNCPTVIDVEIGRYQR